ncbi:hypothetical protein GCM10007315_15390 [Gemmobacter tilapiae]|uniref:Uncharacterized protein n=1 Tax=Neogemmobacter tilapiae TaxID=875041 RepID=A0A918TLX7_9RHOB|nr:hypothetical protein GCM10007315_15390 [Gemmobacter tilapiae]
MGDDGGLMWPIDAGAGLDVAFEIVGVEFDEAGHDQITLAIHGSRWDGGSVQNLGDAAIAEDEGALADLMWQDKGGIGEDGVGHDQKSCLAVRCGKGSISGQASHRCDSLSVGPAPWNR